MRKGLRHRKHRPYFTICAYCRKKNFCRKCFKCKGWLCDDCQPFLEQLFHEGIHVLNTGLCEDCQCELSGF